MISTMAKGRLDILWYPGIGKDIQGLERVVVNRLSGPVGDGTLDQDQLGGRGRGLGKLIRGQNSVKALLILRITIKKDLRL